MIRRGKSMILVTVATATAIAFVGCNDILDNQPGIPTDTLTIEPDDRDARAPLAPPTDDAGPLEREEDAGSSSTCPAGERLCDGVCVSLDDPLHGCSDPSCKPCPSARGNAACRGGVCSIASCDRGYADCNRMASDGCETDLSSAKTCGACNAMCPAAAPLCAPKGGTFECTDGCTPAAPVLCGADCVDPMTSTNHCGACNRMCPAVENGTTTCVAGVCGFTCKAKFHPCAGACATDTDPLACGPACTVCPVPANGRATCLADACGFTCNAGFTKCGDRCVGPNDPTACGAACTVCPVPPGTVATCAAGVCRSTCVAGRADCDQAPANGCEAVLATDPLNCGACGRACIGAICVGGVCGGQAPAP